MTGSIECAYDGAMRGGRMAVIRKVKCEKCQYEWFPKSVEPPVRCAKCRSAYWDRPPRRVKK